MILRMQVVEISSIMVTVNVVQWQMNYLNDIWCLVLNASVSFIQKCTDDYHETDQYSLSIGYLVVKATDLIFFRIWQPK